MGTSIPETAGKKVLDADTIRDWVVQRAKALSVAGGVVVVGIAVYLFWQQSNQIKNERANAALATGQNAFYSGNPVLAKSDLDKVVTRYPGTVGGTQAAILLAQIAYGESKYDDGVKLLTAAQSGAPAQFAPALEELIAAGHSDAKRYDEAASHYLKAANLAPFPSDKDIYRAEAARSYGMAGNDAEARKLWQALATNRESPVLNEARVRLGELDVKAAAK
ncbi:hypothetical protein LBMAG44_11560 [Gemmatimonadota bacterium]|nr:hypothetical protein LBMAG44_11560 [Gemmatimonadota bacterium]